MSLRHRSGNRRIEHFLVSYITNTNTPLILNRVQIQVLKRFCSGYSWLGVTVTAVLCSSI